MRQVFIFALICLSVLTASADEGMWMPDQLPELAAEMEKAGLEVDAASLADLTAHPMGAVIWLGGCTASFVSDQGLVVTNHHCAYGSIQHNSTEENNILENGFFANSFEDELPAAPGSRVLVTIAVDDVTDQILGAIPDGAKGKQRHDAIETAEKKLIAQCESAQENVRCRVSSFYGGVFYKLFTQLEIRDVRLVYAPARSIGKYGGDVDNWMWPRHTGDFSFLRAYVGPDGKPADPSPENVPYRPQHWLRVSARGVRDGDFVMVAGYPGRTNRYRMADEVAFRVEYYYPEAAKTNLNILAAIERAISIYPDAKLKLAPTVSSLNNRTKNYTGLLAGFSRTDVVAAKTKLESDLDAWINADSDRKKKYGSALSELRSLIAKDQINSERDLYWSTMRWSPMLRTALKLYRLSHEMQKPDMERKQGYQERDMKRLRKGMERIEKTYDRRVNRMVAMDRIRMYASLAPEKRIQPFDQFMGISKGDLDEATISARLDWLYDETELDDLETRLSWIGKTPDEFAASADPFIKLAVSLYPAELAMEEDEEELYGYFNEARPRFMEALIAYQESNGLQVYPDANSTLRITTGHVGGYHPRDGIWYEPFTALEGLIEKETGVDPFDSPGELLNAIEAGEFGQYRLEAIDSVPVDFLSTLDTTGGNSGSPTLNARGELVGLLFDGAWESLLSDWYYEPERVRSIHADVRFMLWVMDRVDGAQRLIEEMGLTPDF
jgi:Peptidase S46